jgi:hypothetical protein
MVAARRQALCLARRAACRSGAARRRARPCGRGRKYGVGYFLNLFSFCTKTGLFPGNRKLSAPGSQPSGAPDPRWAGGWACTSHPGVLGSIPKPNERNQGKQGATLCSSTGFLTGPPPWVGSRSPDGWLGSDPRWTGGWVLHLAPDTLEFWCLSSAKLRSTDSVNPRAVLSRVRPRYRHLL